MKVQNSWELVKEYLFLVKGSKRGTRNLAILKLEQLYVETSPLYSVIKNPVMFASFFAFLFLVYIYTL